MSKISQFVHYNILRNMCEPEINNQNNHSIAMIQQMAISGYKKPDIEMGFKLFPIETINRPQRTNDKNTISQEV